MWTFHLSGCLTWPEYRHTNFCYINNETNIDICFCHSLTDGPFRKYVPIDFVSYEDLFDGCPYYRATQFFFPLTHFIYDFELTILTVFKIENNTS